MWNLIPEHKRAAVETALQATFGTTEIDALTILSGGLSSAAVYRLVIQGKPYVLRLVMEIDALRDPTRDYLCMGLAAAAGIAPRVYYAEAAEAVSIIEFLDAKPLGQGFPPPDALIPALAQTIQAIHALPLFPRLVSFLDGIDIFIQIFQSTGLVAPRATVELFKAYAEVQKRYPRQDPDVVSSHNDLNPNNILSDGQRLWVIDWESAFQNDRYVDLAIAANYYLPQEDQREALLTAYFGDRLDDIKQARFFLMRQICRVYYGLILLNFAAAQRPPDAAAETTLETLSSAEFFGQVRAGTMSMTDYQGKVIFGKIMLNQALADMNTSRYAEALSKLP